MTKQQDVDRFCSQFPVRVTITPEMLAMAQVEEIAFDIVPVIRILNRLFILTEDGYYGAY